MSADELISVLKSMGWVERNRNRDFVGIYHPETPRRDIVIDRYHTYAKGDIEYLLETEGIDHDAFFANLESM